MRLPCDDYRKNTERDCPRPGDRNLSLTCDDYLSPAENDAALDEAYAQINTERRVYDAIEELLAEMKEVGIPPSPVTRKLEEVVKIIQTMNTPPSTKTPIEEWYEAAEPEGKIDMLQKMLHIATFMIDSLMKANAAGNTIG